MFSRFLSQRRASIPSFDAEFSSDNKGQTYFRHIDPFNKFDKFLSHLGNLLPGHARKTNREEWDQEQKDYQVLLSNALKIYQIDSTFVNNDLRERVCPPQNLNLVKALDVIFDNAPAMENDFKCYKCYQKNVAATDIESWTSNLSYLSASLSHKFAKGWCTTKVEARRYFSLYSNQPQVQGLIICIIVPRGSTGVVPMFLEHFENFKQNEILFHRTGKLTKALFQEEKSTSPIFFYTTQNGPAIDMLSDKERFQPLFKNRLLLPSDLSTVVKSYPSIRKTLSRTSQRSVDKSFSRTRAYNRKSGIVENLGGSRMRRNR